MRQIIKYWPEHKKSPSSEKYKLLKHETLDKKRPYWYCLLALNWRKVCSWVHPCSIAEVTETCR